MCSWLQFTSICWDLTKLIPSKLGTGFGAEGNIMAYFPIIFYLSLACRTHSMLKSFLLHMVFFPCKVANYNKAFKP